MKIEIYGIGWYEPDGRKGHTPPKESQPARNVRLTHNKTLDGKFIPGTRLSIKTVFEVLHPIQSNEVYETEDENDKEEEWTNELPTDSPKHRGLRANHLLYIITKPEQNNQNLETRMFFLPRDPIKPKYTNCL